MSCLSPPYSADRHMASRLSAERKQPTSAPQIGHRSPREQCLHFAGSSDFSGGEGGEEVPVGFAGVEEGPDPVVAEASGSEADAFDPFDQVVDRFGGSVRHPGVVPGDDLVEPADQGAAEGVDLWRAGVVLEVGSELGDEA